MADETKSAEKTTDELTEEVMPEGVFTLSDDLKKLKGKLPQGAFKEAAAKYAPCECVIHSFAVTDAGTVVVLSAGALGMRKETIEA